MVKTILNSACTDTFPEPRPAVRRMKQYHPPLGGRDGLRLDFNENTIACSPRVLEVLGGISAADLTKYPEREPVEAIVSEHLGLKAEQVLLTNGVDEAIHALCQTFLDPCDEVLFPVPTYAMYEIYASSTGATVKTVRADRDFKFPMKTMLAAITPKTKVIAIANPNSPTGTTVGRAQILEICRRAPHAAVLVDEAYYHFFGETVLDLIGRAPNLLIARTFSKAYGLASLRLGMLAASAEIQQWLRTAISPYSVNGLALACLPAAIEDAAYLKWYVDEVKAARAMFVEKVAELGVRQWPSAANFVLIDIGPKLDEFVRSMRRRGVLTRDRSRDPGCDGCVRVTIGTLKQTEHALDAMADVLFEIGWKRR